MTISQVPEFFYPPPVMWSSTGTPGFSPNLLSNENRKIAFILPITQSGQLETFEFKVGAVTQSPVNGLKVSFQDVSAGVPVSADYFYNVTGTIASDSWVIPPYITDDGTSTGNRKTVSRLTEDDSVTRLACVIEFESYQSGDSLYIQGFPQNVYSPKSSYIAMGSSSGTWSKSFGVPVMSLVYESQDYLETSESYAVNQISTLSVSLSTTPDEVGLAFAVNSPVLVSGVYVLVNPTDKLIATIYDTQDFSLIGRGEVNLFDYKPNDYNVDYIVIRFDDDVRLEANNLYLLSLVTIESPMDVYFFSGFGSAQMGSLPGGSTWRYWNRVDEEPAWTEDEAKRPVFGLLVSGIDQDTSGGSGE